MGAFNWIVFEGQCPCCSSVDSLRAQTHIAASYDALGGERFHDKEYRLNEPMHWWGRDSPRWGQWREDGNARAPHDGEHLEECCYSSCGQCGGEFYAVIAFVPVMPVAVKQIGQLDLWPAGFTA